MADEGGVRPEEFVFGSFVMVRARRMSYSFIIGLHHGSCLVNKMIKGSDRSNAVINVEGDAQ